MQTHLVTILKKMAAVDGVEKPAAVLLNQSSVQANRKSNTIAFVMKLCAREIVPVARSLVILAGVPSASIVIILTPYCANPSES